MVFKYLAVKSYGEAQYLLDVGLPLLKQIWELQNYFCTWPPSTFSLGIVDNLGFGKHELSSFSSVSRLKNKFMESKWFKQEHTIF